MRKTKFFQSELGTGADADLVFRVGDELLENTSFTVMKAVDRYNSFTIQTLAGSVRVLGSLDGTNFGDQLAMAIEPAITADAPDAQAGSLIAATSSAKFAHFVGDYRALKFQQVGATPAQIRVLLAADE